MSTNERGLMQIMWDIGSKAKRHFLWSGMAVLLLSVLAMVPGIGGLFGLLAFFAGLYGIAAFLGLAVGHCGDMTENLRDMWRAVTGKQLYTRDGHEAESRDLTLWMVVTVLLEAAFYGAGKVFLAVGTSGASMLGGLIVGIAAAFMTVHLIGMALAVSVGFINMLRRGYRQLRPAARQEISEVRGLVNEFGETARQKRDRLLVRENSNTGDSTSTTP